MMKRTTMRAPAHDRAFFDSRPKTRLETTIDDLVRRLTCNRDVLPPASCDVLEAKIAALRGQFAAREAVTREGLRVLRERFESQALAAVEAAA